MNRLLSHLRDDPLRARVVPFVLFVVLTFAQGWGPPAAAFWLYALKTLLGALLLVAVWPVVTEMRWHFSLAGLLTGVAVFAVWVGLDPLCEALGWAGSYPKWKLGEPWNPHAVFGRDSALAWFFIGVRVLGSTLVVPPLEEAFYRSFLYRYAEKADFLAVPLRGLLGRPFLITTVLFGLAHREWLAALICGAAYQGLVCWKGRLGDAMTAHAVTNLLLGLWVAGRGQWQYW